MGVVANRSYKDTGERMPLKGHKPWGLWPTGHIKIQGKECLLKDINHGGCSQQVI
ncbi:hypothetical protein DPMN_086734 [Dreissena polymorpha]|uniref:Uncharacterized protein n=1 Tax=Dreissena polymorpha TaxID=45954 RepID=A0A9D4KRF6_DREPO|nr:hypothetical protein DPMN_086734 [Dreissena polymorpha]